MKIGVFSDIHIHDYTRFSTNGSRLASCLDCLDHILKYDVDFFLFCGDLFDSQIAVSTQCIIRTVNIIKESKKEIFAISGNHDMANKNIARQYFSSLEIVSGMTSNFIVLDYKAIQVEGLKFYGCPYMHRVDLPKESLDCNYLLMHNTPKQIDNKMIPYDVDLSDSFFASFECVFLGHIHKHQKFDNAVMVGSPLHRDAGDLGQDKGFLVFDIDSNTFERVILDYPVFDHMPKEKEHKVEITKPMLRLETPEKLIEDFCNIKKVDKNTLQTGLKYLHEI
jgi:DNA repair exonuclease SbcCD nuclease subunit